MIEASLMVLTEQLLSEFLPLLDTIPLSMRQYTGHGNVHVENVVDLMDRLLPSATIESLKPLELAALIQAALLHDIGMVASVEEIERFMSDDPESESRSYRGFRAGYPEILSRINKAQGERRTWIVLELEDYLMSEFLRKEHGRRVKRFIHEYLSRRLLYENNTYADRLAAICMSHTQSYDSVESLPPWEVVRSGGERCNWRFIAILLRLADILDFDWKRTPPILFRHLGEGTRVEFRKTRTNNSR